jgi:hypothetical protein
MHSLRSILVKGKEYRHHEFAIFQLIKGHSFENNGMIIESELDMCIVDKTIVEIFQNIWSRKTTNVPATL